MIRFSILLPIFLLYFSSGSAPSLFNLLVLIASMTGTLVAVFGGLLAFLEGQLNLRSVNGAPVAKGDVIRYHSERTEELERDNAQQKQRTEDLERDNAQQKQRTALLEKHLKKTMLLLSRITSATGSSTAGDHGDDLSGDFDREFNLLAISFATPDSNLISATPSVVQASTDSHVENADPDRSSSLQTRRWSKDDGWVGCPVGEINVDIGDTVASSSACTVEMTQMPVVARSVDEDALNATFGITMDECTLVRASCDDVVTPSSAAGDDLNVGQVVYAFAVSSDSCVNVDAPAPDQRELEIMPNSDSSIIGSEAPMIISNSTSPESTLPLSADSVDNCTDTSASLVSSTPTVLADSDQIDQLQPVIDAGSISVETFAAPVPLSGRIAVTELPLESESTISTFVVAIEALPAASVPDSQATYAETVVIRSDHASSDAVFISDCDQQAPAAASHAESEASATVSSSSAGDAMATASPARPVVATKRAPPPPPPPLSRKPTIPTEPQQ